MRDKKEVKKKKKRSLIKNPNTKSEKLREIVRGILVQGMSHGAAKEELRIARKELGLITVSELDLDNMVSSVSEEIRREYSTTREHIVSLHIARYDDDIKGLLSKDYDHLDRGTAHKMEMSDLWDCLDVMFAKEKLLQIHGKSLQVRINNKLNAKIIKKETNYDLSHLNLQEKVEFLTLLHKAKKNYSVLQSVKLSDKKEEETIDIDHEVIENNNVALIKKKQSTAKGDNASATGNALLELQQKIQKALSVRARQEFQKKGSKNV